MASSQMNIPIKSCSGKITSSVGNACKISDYPSGYTKSNIIYLSNIVDWTDNSFHGDRFDIVVILGNDGIYVVPTSSDPIGKNITIYYS